MGQTGSAKLQRLQSSVGEMGLTPGLHDQNDSFIVTIFFDSAGRLQQVSVHLSKQIIAGSLMCGEGGHSGSVCNKTGNSKLTFLGKQAAAGSFAR